MSPPTPEALLGHLLRDVAIAWRALTSYPAGHPSAAAALARALASLEAVHSAVGRLELAASREQLIWREQKLPGPTSAKLAELLRKRSAAGVTIEPGVDVGELESFLRALLADPRRARDAGSLERQLEAEGVRRIRAHDLDFSGFSLVEGEAEEPPLPDAGGLWESLVRRLVAGGHVSGERLATWIAGGGGAIGLLAALLGRAPGLTEEDREWARRTVCELAEAAAAEFFDKPSVETARGIARLRPMLDAEPRARLDGALRRALAGRDDGGAARGLLAAELGEETMDSILAGESARPRPGAPADAASAPAPTPLHASTLLQQVRELFADADLDSAALPEQLLDVAETTLEIAAGPDRLDLPPAATEFASHLDDPWRDRELATALLDLSEQPELPRAALEPLLGRLEPVARRLFFEGHLRQGLELVERLAARAGADPSCAALLERLAGAEAIEALVTGLERHPVELEEPARRLLERLGPAAVPQLLELLAETDDRATRHRLLHLLTAMGTSVVGAAVDRLSDPRWYVVRNMLVLLRRIGDPGSVHAVRRCADHADLRVRLEAIRNLFAFDDSLPRELLRQAIANPDPRLAEEAVELAGSRGIEEAVEPLVELLQRPDRLGRRRALRLKAIAALGQLGQARALEGLRRFAAPWWRFQRVAIEEKRALFRTLGSYPEEARRPFVRHGARSRDAELRRLARELTSGAEARR